MMLAHDARFHEIILAATGNDVVGQAYAQTHCHLHVFRLFPVDRLANTIARFITLRKPRI